MANSRSQGIIKFNPQMIDEENIVEFSRTLNKTNFAELLRYLSDFYHNDSSLVEDKTYDELEEIYKSKFGEYGAVGSEPKGEKIKLPYYLGSLRKIKKENEITKWMKDHEGPYIVEDKIDGLTLLLKSKVIKGKRMNYLYTRGDGFFARDVSHLLAYIKLPQLPKSDFADISIRGEIVMLKDTFSRVGAGFKNARNLVSGIINATKNVNTSLAKELNFYAYRIMGSKTTPTQQITVLQTLGFDTPTPVSSESLSKEILENYFVYRQGLAPYEMDGLVVYQDVAMDYPVGDDPYHVVAFKTETDQGITTVTAVTWEASKDRILNPVVHYEPIILSGATLQRASGYNARFIVENNIGPGAKILITRSGDVIPKILQVLEPSPKGPDFPQNRDYEWNENQVEFIVLEDDDEVLAHRLECFINKLGIKAFGPERVKMLLKAGIKDVKALLLVTPEQINKIAGLGTVLSNQLYEELHTKIKEVPGPQIMAASCLFPNVGLRRFEAIFEVYPDFMDMLNEDPDVVEEKIRGINGFDKLASEIAQRLILFSQWLDDNPMIKVASPKRNQIIIPTPTKNSVTSPTKTNMTVVFSGFRDKNLEAQIHNIGGKVTTSVSRNTTLVVMKDINDRKGKAKDAISRGIQLISKEDFISQYL